MGFLSHGIWDSPRSCSKDQGLTSWLVLSGLWLAIVLGPHPAKAHEVDQRLGAFQSTEGESRVMARLSGRAMGPQFAGGQADLALSITAQSESIRSQDPYTLKNFQGPERREQTFGLDAQVTVAKRTELSIGGSKGGDKITETTSARASLGQWFLGDQLRIGVTTSSSQTTRPMDSFLDYDSATVVILPEAKTDVGAVNIKAILNPRTTVTGEYTLARSSDRPLLRAWAAGIRQFIDDCQCAIHGDFGRAINLGKLNTNMSAGELTGSQFTVSYLQSLWKDAHSRLSYRYAREDEFTRAYGDHLVFGADTYVAGLSQELKDLEFAGAARPLLVDVAATRYIHNQAGSATTVELGGSVKF